MNGALMVSVDSELTDTRSGVGISGKSWEITTQTVWATFVDATGVPDRFPTKIAFMLEKGARPYKVGSYFVNPSSFKRGDFDSLISRPVLAAMPKAA